MKKIKRLFILFYILLLQVSSCGRTRESLEKECRLELTLASMPKRSDETWEEFENSRTGFLFSYYFCMSSAKKYGTENPVF